MELRHLRSFVVTAELEHFGRAAQRLAIVQPALSRQMRELEDEIGAPLFTRLPRGVRLTAAGRALRAEARAILDRVDRAVGQARDVAAGRTGSLGIGFVDTAMHAPALPRLLDAFRCRQPGIRLELHQRTSLAQADGLRSGALDVGFVYHRPERQPALAAHRILDERIVLAAPRAHPLAGRRRVRLAELRDEPFVWIPRALSPAYHDLVFSACAAHGFRPRVVQEGGADSAILSLVAAGAGLSFYLASTRHRRPPGVALVPIADLRAVLRLEAVWRMDNANPALPAFLAALPPEKK